MKVRSKGHCDALKSGEAWRFGLRIAPFRASKTEATTYSDSFRQFGKEWYQRKAMGKARTSAGGRLWQESGRELGPEEQRQEQRKADRQAWME